MELAIAEAERAAREGEVPVGCVILDRSGLVVGRGYNRREMDQSPLAHAEILAIAEASARLGSWRLVDTTLIATLEPCVMCSGAIIQARIPRLVYGCLDPKGGAIASLYRIADDPRLNHRVEIVSAVAEERCSRLLTSFFGDLRERKRKRNRND
ncbi:MAG: tRNA adenosine(34) deaminase TadA [Myxococcales bacterium]|nr:tRNA adenosine(34) deaminase TadA [Myxococcales bacterium]